MKKFSLIIFVMAVLELYSITVQAEGGAFAQVEQAMETEALKLSFDSKTSTGTVVGKACDQCKQMTVNITPQTKAYKASKEVLLVRIQTRRGKDATVFFSKNTKNVTRIKW